MRLALGSIVFVLLTVWIPSYWATNQYLDLGDIDEDLFHFSSSDFGQYALSDVDNYNFELLDYDYNGILDPHELLYSITLKKPSASDIAKITELESILKGIDRNKDNAISFEEYLLAPSESRQILSSMAPQR